MLLRIFASNFLSFKDEVELSFVSNDNSNEDTFFSIEKEYQKKKKTYTINKVSAIYGANASGKTNILKIIKFIKEMILYSHNQNFSLSRLGYRPYLLSTKKKESKFSIDFFINNTLYSYSFIIDFYTDKIIEECLLEYNSQKATTLFKRINKTFPIINEKFLEGKERKDFVRENSLALSVFSNMSGEISSKIWNFFNEKVHIFQVNNNNPTVIGQFNLFDTMNMIDQYPQDFPGYLNSLLSSADININRMDYKIEEKSIDEIQGFKNNFPQNNEKIKFFSNSFNHFIYNEKGEIAGEINFDPNDESTGTNRLVSLSGSFYNVIKNGMSLFIDELDSSIHPLLMKEIISIFNSQNNLNGGQLIFTSHDVSLLDETYILPKDQIWFVDKSKTGESSLYSLDDFNGINKIKSIEKAYLLGKFDAIPYINKI